jgi:hypothetical protein
VKSGRTAVSVLSVKSCCRPQHDEDEAHAVAQAGHEMPVAPAQPADPRRQECLRQKREAHRKARRQARQHERADRAGQLLLAVLADDLVNDDGARGRVLARELFLLLLRRMRRQPLFQRTVGCRHHPPSVTR